jgi:hypothetical protein
MTLINSLPAAWTPADQAAADNRQAERNERRNARRIGSMGFLTTIAASSFLSAGVVTLIMAVEKVALPLIIAVAGLFLLVPGIFGSLEVGLLVSNSDHPVKDTLSSIGKGALIATCVEGVALTILHCLPI